MRTTQTLNQNIVSRPTFEPRALRPNHEGVPSKQPRHQIVQVVFKAGDIFHSFISSYNAVRGQD